MECNYDRLFSVLRIVVGYSAVLRANRDVFVAVVVMLLYLPSDDCASRHHLNSIVLCYLHLLYPFHDVAVDPY